MECQRCSIWFCHPAVQLKPVRCQIFCKIWIQTHAKVEKRCLFQDIHMAASSNMFNICNGKSHIDQIVNSKLRRSLFPLWQCKLLTAFNMLWNNFKVVPLEIGKANVENIWYAVHQSLHFYYFWYRNLWYHLLTRLIFNGNLKCFSPWIFCTRHRHALCSSNRQFKNFESSKEQKFKRMPTRLDIYMYL